MLTYDPNKGNLPFLFCILKSRDMPGLKTEKNYNFGLFSSFCQFSWKLSMLEEKNLTFIIEQNSGNILRIIFLTTHNFWDNLVFYKKLWKISRPWHVFCHLKNIFITEKKMFDTPTEHRKMNIWWKK